MRILVVEDDPIAAAVLGRVASQAFDCTVVGHSDADAALADCEECVPDLVLVDYQMPGMDGVEFIGHLRAKKRYEHVPLVMITADDARDIRIKAINAGATDFLNKPVDPEELKVRSRNLLRLRQAQLKLADRARFLAAEVQAATRQILEREEEIIWRLARAIEYRDGGTGEHVARVAVISRIIAEELGLEPEHCRNIYLSAPLHDVGKVAISDAILNKPGKLTDEEFAAMREHVNIGATILSNGDSELVQIAAAIAATHHEKWDGTGYPKRLSGHEIPVEGRIVAVADVFDALCARRSYKDAWHPEEALAEIVRCSGRHFDPECVAAFERGWGRIVKILLSEQSPSAA